MTPRRLPFVPDQSGVFTTEQALACGWTMPALKHAVRCGRIDRLWRGVYAPPVPDDAVGRDRRRLQLAVAAAVTNAGLLVSHLSAAAVLGWPSWAPDPRACVSHDDGQALTCAPGVHVHRAQLGRYDRWRVGSLAVTSPGRTVVDIAREHGPEAGLCAADAAAHAGALRPIDLQRAINQSRDWPGARNAARLVEWLDPRAESMFESRSRWAMRLAGLPVPLTQVALYDRRTGRFVARVDFFWPELGIVGEADGRGKYRTRAGVVAEKNRENAVRRLNLGFVRWEWAELRRFSVVTSRFWEAEADGAPRVGRASTWRAEQAPIPAFRYPETIQQPPMWELGT